ncbi:MAG: AI-2E family transporter [Lachnospiraceae bacterium]|nr:AI-2E family transporter [Lachnospiraceae bacterium]
MRFSIFNKKRGKKDEKGHRDPIIVRFYKAADESPTVSTLAYVEEPSESSAASETTAVSSQSEKKEGSNNRKHRFERNSKYFSISVYSLFTILIALILALVIFNIASVISILGNVISVLAPFIGAGLLAFIVSPLVNFFDEYLFERLFHIKKAGLRKALSVILSFIIVLGLLALAITILIPQVIGSIKELLGKLSVVNLNSMTASVKNWVSGVFPSLDLSGFDSWVSSELSTLTDKIATFVTQSIPSIFTAGFAVVKGVINFLLAIAISIYMVCDKRRIARASTALTYSILPLKKAEAFISTSRECGQIFFGFIIGKTIDSIIIGILTFIILTIGGLPYPLLVSVIVGVTNMIPFFGPFIGAVPGILLYLCLDPVYAFAFAIIILAIQQFDGWVLGPLILGDSTGVSPLWVIFGITVGGAYFDVVGMFLGVPVTAVVVYLARRIVSKRLKKKKVEVS